MDTGLDVVFRDMKPSIRIRDRIEDYVHKLDRFDDRVQRCRVVVQSPRRGLQKTGSHVTIRAALSNQEIVIDNRSPQHRAHYGATVAVRQAFETLMRRLEQVAQARQSEASPKAGKAVRRGRAIAAAAESQAGRRGRPIHK
jgi:ribosome-associated translation inhibitor RaiA